MVDYLSKTTNTEKKCIGLAVLYFSKNKFIDFVYAVVKLKIKLKILAVEITTQFPEFTVIYSCLPQKT